MRQLVYTETLNFTEHGGQKTDGMTTEIKNKQTQTAPGTLKQATQTAPGTLVDTNYILLCCIVSL